ncbi:hypothetical protein ABIF29_008478 [Bradyrhizobium elkanii]|uniref:Uncharacterized protein n=1 Tax=Bradyrhizobium elkanii TaxID=29448 RepID=A0ABV4FEZ4_BRAEL
MPRRHRGADNGDDQQHHLAELGVLRHLRHEEVRRDLADRRVHHQDHGHQQQAAGDQHDAEAFEAAEVAGRDRQHHDDSRGQYAPELRDAEEMKCERDADELGDDGQRVQYQEVDDAEGTPELAEALEDQPRMADPGDRAEPHHHLLVDVEHRDQQQQCPKQRGAVILSGLGIGAERTGVVVADHHDQAGADDRQQRLQPGRQGRARRGVVARDAAERAVDVAGMRAIENGGLCGLAFGHFASPRRLSARREGRRPRQARTSPLP